MGFFRRSGPTLEECIEKREFQCIVRYYLKGGGDDAAIAIGALLIIAERDPEHLAEALGDLNVRDIKRAAEGIVQSGGPGHPAVFALAGYAGPDLGHALGRAVIRCGEDAFDDLVTRTASADPNTRIGAIHLLGFIGKAGIPVLKEILYRTDGDEQRTAATCLRHLGWAPEKPDEKPMFFYLCDDWKELIRLKERALPLLFSLVKCADPDIRKHAIQSMGEIGDVRVVPIVLPYVDDGDPSVRIAAINALIHYDTPETEQRLVGALGHADSQIRIDAAHALKRKGWTPRSTGEEIRYTIANGNWDAVIRLGDRVIPDLIRIVRAGDNEWAGAVYALAGLGPDATQELQVLLPSIPDPRQKDVVRIFRKSAEKHRLRRENLQKEYQKEQQKNEAHPDDDEPKGPSDSEILETQKRVIEGFKWMRLQKVATEQIYAIIHEGVEVHNISFEMAIAALSSKDEAIRAAAIDVLSMKGERAYPYIMKAAYDKSTIVRTAVADAVGFVAQPSMIKVLALLSKDPVTDVRLATVRALQMMNDQRAFPSIVSLFSDEDAMVRDAASHAAATYGRFGLPILIRSLHMKNPEIRIAAAAALGEICDVRSLQYLIPCLGEPDIRVRDAIRAAVVQHDYRAIEPLQAFIAETEEGEAKNTALLALYEIDEDLINEYDVESPAFEIPVAPESSRDTSASKVDSILSGIEKGGSGKNMMKPGDQWSASERAASDEVSSSMPDEGELSMDSRTCEELVLRIDGGEEALSSALLVDLYDQKSSLKSDLMSALKGSDREFAMHAATLLTKIGWSPDGNEEETLYLLASGRIAEMKKGGAGTARILSGMVQTMPPSVQNVIVEVLSGIGGKEGISGLARMVAGDAGAVSEAAAESLAGMDTDAVPFIREVAASQEGAKKRRLQKVIQIIERSS